jgi:hypothetical protein
MSDYHDGGCLCKTIRYHARGEPLRAYICHCTFCQMHTGTAFAEIVWYEKDDVEMTGDGLTTYSHKVDGTDRFFHLHFCPKCGTTVTASVDRSPSRRFIMVGTFDDRSWVTPERQIWTRSARHWLPSLDELEIHEDGAMPPLKTS